jgi:D-amino peptidase
MRIHICTDLEGVSGVTLFKQTREEGPAYEQARLLLTADINAAVQGCLDGGADYVCVLDGHGHPLNIVPEELHPGAEYHAGRNFPDFWGDLQSGFDCAMLVGYHAMAHTPDGVLCHTQSSRSDSRYWYNGLESGEIAQCALAYGHYGVPVVMVSGDTAACREAVEFLGENIVTADVKHGYGRECCRMVAPQKAHELIRAGAREALSRIAQCRPYVVEKPLHARHERLAESVPDEATPEEVAAAPHLTFEKVCENQLDIYRF